MNQATGRILILDKAHGAVIQLDESGNPVNFSATGSPKVSASASGTEIAVDNSGGATQGNFYVLSRGTSVQGFAPSGAKLAGWPVPQKSDYGQLYSIAVDPDGDVWLGHFGNPYLGMEVAPSGTPTGKTIPIVGAKYFSFCDYCQTLAFDSHYNAWYTVEDGSLIRSDKANDYDGTKVHSVLGQLVARDVAIDPSTDDAFWNHGNKIAATKFTEPYVQEEPFEILPGLNTDAHEFTGDGQTLFATEGRTTINIFKRVLPQLPDALGAPEFSKVKSESADVTGLVDTGGGGPTTYHFEYGPDTTLRKPLARRRRASSAHHLRRPALHRPARRARPGHHLPRPLRGHQRDRHGLQRRRSAEDPAPGPLRQTGSLRKRSRPQADRSADARRLPRLRARLGPLHGRL